MGDMIHDGNCRCVLCEMGRAYEAMGKINLELATTYQQLESEADVKCIEYAIGA